jgi:protease IV
MDFEQNSSQIPPMPPIYNVIQNTPVVPKRRGWKIFWGIITTFSILANITLLLLLVGVVAVFATGQRGFLTEDVIQAGPKTTKIAVISVNGIIDDMRSKDVYDQIKTAKSDSKVKGLIIRVDSPGGMVSSSDQIYNEISKYRRETNKPVVAFMQGIAASGGYYTTVSCDKIIAEPTVITGSIGVIMGHFVLQELLEQKLGIQPVIIKSGPKKDWPSPFQMVTDEQKQYLQDKVITPAYERFVQLVAEGRSAVLTIDDVRRLADGSIYSANEALDEKLIDQIGYLDDAINLAKALAKLEQAEVIEYRKPFSLSDVLSAGSAGSLKITGSALYELSTPKVMYLWNGSR